jgi:hypothetical protein
MKVAVLYLSHLIKDSFIARYKKLVNDISNHYDVYWVFQTDNGISGEILKKNGVNIFGFTLEDLNRLNYSPLYERIFGSEHFITAFFSQQHPEYDYYWVIEYDVVFTGHWNTFFSAFASNDSDLLSSHIAVHNDSNNNWPWWASLSFNEENAVQPENYAKSFNPVYRISRRALSFLDDYLQKEHNKGYFEVVFTTALYNNGFKIQDFGGTGTFVPEGFRNRFYIQGEGMHNGTMRWQPEFSQEEIEALGTKDKLFHPIKK